MKFIFDNIQIVILIAGICMLMLYPYIGAGLLLSVLCGRSGYLLVIVFLSNLLSYSLGLLR